MKSINILLALMTFCAFTKGEIKCFNTYLVAEEDSCISIADKHNISVIDLINSNPNIDCEILAVGSSICVNQESSTEDEISEEESLGTENEDSEESEEENLGTEDEDNEEIEEESLGTEDEDNEEIEEGNLEKRSPPMCSPKKGVKINREEYYKRGLPGYKLLSGSVITAIHNVDGCHSAVDFAHKVGIIKLSTSKELFTPACNSHDVCYDCLKGKRYCDNKFLNDMKFFCSKKYSLADPTYGKCVHDAELFYTGVVLKGGSSYKDCEKDKLYDRSSNCAFCGHTFSVDAALHPFFIY